jgi:hypothetical protein
MAELSRGLLDTSVLIAREEDPGIEPLQSLIEVRVV